jgi:hypothetical protein
MYVLFKNSEYANVIASNTGAVPRNEDQIEYINPERDDVIVIDAHCGSNMVELKGLEIVRKLQKRFRKTNLYFKVLSWFNEDSKQIKEKMAKMNLIKDNIVFIQLPVNDYNKLKEIPI